MTATASSIDLKQLPVRAIVALSARCVRRVHPVFLRTFSHPDAKTCSKVIDAAIQLAEGFARGEEPDAKVVDSAIEATMQTLMVATEAGKAGTFAAFVANAAYAVVDATKVGMQAAAATDPTEAASKVAESAKIATDAAIGADENVVTALNNDFESLNGMGLGTFPEIGKRVDPSEYGILGPLFTAPADDGNSQVANAGSVRASAESHRDEGFIEDSTDRSSKTKVVKRRPSKKKEGGDKKLDEVRAVMAKMRQMSEQLEIERSSLELQREELEKKRRSFETELSNLREEQQRLVEEKSDDDGRSESLEGELAQVEEERETLDRERGEFAAEKETLTSELTRLKTQQEEFKDRQGTIGDDLKNLQEQQQQLEEQKKTLDERESQLNERQNQIEIDRTDVENKLQKLKQDTEQLEQDRKSLEENRTQIEERAKAAAVPDLPQDAIARLKNERVKLETSVKKLRAEHNKMKASKLRFREQYSAFQTARARLEEEKVLIRETALLLDKQRSGMKQQPAKGERAARPSAGSASGNANTVTPLRLLLEPGEAPSDELTAMLKELSELYRKLGGPGTQFELKDARQETAPADGSSEPKVISEIVLSPAKIMDETRRISGVMQWNHFKSSLLMVLQIDSGLQRAFDDGKAAPKRHRGRTCVAEALKQVAKETTGGGQETGAGEQGQLPIDIVNHQLQKLEELFERLQSEFAAVIELVDSTQALETTEPNAGGKKKRFSLWSVLLYFAVVSGTNLMIPSIENSAAHRSAARVVCMSSVESAAELSVRSVPNGQS